jgi:hypothetical protein
VRVHVHNTGKRPAKCCRIFLARLEEVHPSGKTTRAPFFDSRQVAWAGFLFTPFDLPRGLEFYADVTRVSKATSGWAIFVDRLFSNERVLEQYSGTYRFHLMATADNTEPATCIVDVTYNGDWHNLRAVRV